MCRSSLKASDGVRDRSWHLSTTLYAGDRFLLPPLPEQAAIVRYLDYVDRRVRRLVRAKRKLIALLTEQKQAIIHRAVTRGLDPDVPLKDSGVEWLGEVPEHWEVVRSASHFCSRSMAHTTRAAYVTRRHTVSSARTSRLTDGSARTRSTSPKPTSERDRRNVSSSELGDVVYCKDASNLGESVIAHGGFGLRSFRVCIHVAALKVVTRHDLVRVSCCDALDATLLQDSLGYSLTRLQLTRT